MIEFIVAYILIELVVVAEAAMSRMHDLKTASQIAEIQEQKRQVTWLEHTELWGNFFLIAPASAFIISQYFLSWHIWGVLVSLALSILFCSGFIAFWKKGGQYFDRSWMIDNKLTPIGWVHILFMAISFFAALQFYFFTSKNEISNSTDTLISIAFMIHVIGGFVFPEVRKEEVNGRRVFIATMVIMTIYLGWQHLFSFYHL